MLRSAGIRSKILAVLVVPLVLLGLAAGALGTQQVLRSLQAQQAEKLTDVGGILQRLSLDLAVERSTTKGVLQGDAAALQALPAARATVDEGVAELAAAVALVDLDRLPDRVGQAVAATLATHDELRSLRTGVDDGSILLGRTAESFDQIIDAHLQLPSRVGPTVGDQQTADLVVGQGHLLRARDLYLDEREIGLRLLAGTATSTDISDLRAMESAQGEALELWAFAVDAPEGSDEELDAPGDRRGTGWSVAAARATLASPGATSQTGLTPEAWQTTVDARLDDLQVVIEDNVRQSTARAGEASVTSTALAALVVGLSVLGLGVALLTSLVLARRITGPLRELTAAATSVREQLPRMVEQMRSPGQMPDIELPRIAVAGDDEVGRLAAAFNAVNDTVVEVAEEQAALRGSIAETFVNVARRNQVLLSRQLSFIDHLEQREENPDTLENLFRLDHLATRMRRNAESLLVLANIDAGRRLRQPLALSDVIRTAASEIEQYERVNLALQVDPPTMGHLSLQLAHLLAELLENGTNFSEPHTPVLVATSRTAAGVRITVTDEGLGLTDDEIEVARAKISDFAADDVVTSQRLGYFVVGRLARRLGVTVGLRRGVAKGLVVTVDLPPSLFVPGTVKAAVAGPAAVEAPAAPSAPAPRAADPAPAAPAAPAPVATTPGSPVHGAPSARPQVPAARPGRLAARQDAPAPLAPAPVAPVADPVAPSAPAARTVAPVLPVPLGTSIPVPGQSPAPAGPEPVVAPGGSVLPRRGRPAAPATAAGTTPAVEPAPDAPAAAATAAPSPQGDVPPVPELHGRTPAAAPPAEADGAAAPRRAGLFGAFRARTDADLSDAPALVPPAGPPAATTAPVAAAAAPAIPVAAVDEPAPSAPFVPAAAPSLGAPLVARTPSAPAPAPAPSTAPASALHAGPGAPLPVRRAPAPAAVATAAPTAPLDPVAPAVPVARPLPPTPFPATVESPVLPLVASPTSILPGGGGTRRRGRRSLFGAGRTPAEAAAAQPVQPTLPAVPFPAPAHAPAPRPAAAPAPPVPAQATGPVRTVAPAGPAPLAPAAPSGPAAPAHARPAGGTGPRPAAGAARLPSRPVPAAHAPAAHVADPAPAPPGGVPVVPALADGEAVRQRSMLASEALSELSRLSSYSPSSVEGRGGPAPLVRRQPAASEAARLPQKPTGPAPERRPRSAADVRSMLSGFQSGVTRGRAGGDTDDDGAPEPGDARPAAVPAARTPLGGTPQTTAPRTTDTRTTD